MNISKSLILIHGFTSKKEDLIDFAYKLSKNKFNVILFELAFHGSKSPKNKEDWLYRTITESVIELEKLIKSLKHKDVFIIGVSLGSMITDMFLQKHYLVYPNIKKVVYLLYNPDKICLIKKIKYHRDLSFFITDKSFLMLQKKLSNIIPNYQNQIQSYILNGKDDPWIPYWEVSQHIKNCDIKYDVVTNVGHDVSDNMINMTIDFLLN